MNVRRFTSFVATTLTCLALVSPASAELDVVLRITGSKGEIKGSVVQKGREGSIRVVAVDHELKAPRDAATGLATGRRQHGTLTVTKLLDKSSVPLRAAWVGNERLKEVTLQFWQPKQSAAGAGQEVAYFTITLKNASVATIRLNSPNNLHTELTRLPAQEFITFSYEEITWKWNESGENTSDSWAPNNN
jgi:type VI secretion system secreted protein Hcp